MNHRSKTCQLTFKRIGKSSLSSSSQPRSIAVGDFNNDNRTDIVVGNSGTDNIGIFLSNIDGTFAKQQTYSTGSHSLPYSVVVNDFNNDNCLDIAVANYGTNNIGIFLGYVNGTFANQKIFSTDSSRPLFITSDDFNNDNRSDIAVANYGTDNIGVLLGYGDGSFQDQITSFTDYDSLPYSLAVGDFDRDDHLDIAIADYGTDNIGIRLGYGNGSFANQQTYTTAHGSNPSSVAVGDFNNDNHLDIVVANNGSGDVGILFGLGNGTFTAQKTYSINSNSHLRYINIGDFDGNNELDVVVVDTSNDQIHILPGYGNGTFATVTTYDAITGSSPFSVAVVDFNNDNQSDIVVANYDTDNVLVLTGYTSAPSARQKNYYFANRATPGSVAVRDFNNDNHLDIVATGLTLDGILLMTNAGNGTFVGETTFSTGNNSRPQQLCANDLNNDNRMDIVTADLGSDSVSILLGQGNGTFASVMTYSTGIGSSPSRVTVGDVNNDNQLDIISSNSGTDSVGVLLGYGNGSFNAAVMYSTGIGSIPNAVTVGDINNDNHLDIVTANYYSNSISILFGNGSGTFTMLLFYSMGYDSSPVSIVLADFNSDKCLDIAIANSKVGNVDVFLGYGNGSFRTPMSYLTGSISKPYSIIVADFNHDNRSDIAVTLLGNDEVIILFGHDNGSFELARTYFTGDSSRPIDIGVGDINNDKTLEIVVSLWGTGFIAVLTEYFAAKFANETTYSTGSVPQPYSIAVGDLNNDNRSDIVVANSGTDNLGIIFGLGNGSFGSQVIYSTGFDSHPQYVIIGDLNKDNHLDIITISSKHDSLSIIIGYGNGTFAPQIIFATGDGAYPSAVALGDFNNDNRSDLVVTNTATDSIAILVGYDYALFERQSVYRIANSSDPYAVVTGDFNNDNYSDIATVFFDSGTVGILLGYGNGSFDDMIIYPQSTHSLLIALAVGDVNSDDRLDIAIADYGTNNVIILLGYGNGNFAIGMNFSTGDESQPYAIVIADFNKDGRLDIAVANSHTNNVGILLGYGNGSFATVMTYPTGDGSHPFAIIASDFNKDDRPDIAVVNQDTSNVGILLGYGNGSFAGQVTYSTGSYSIPYSIIVSDFSGDDQLDIAIADYNKNSIGIFLGYGNGTFHAIGVYPSEKGALPVYITVGDFNNDNKSDIALVDFGANDVVIYFGFGHGVFYTAYPYSTGIVSGPWSLAIGDFNNDNRSDFVVANRISNDISIFLGCGSESYGGVSIYSVGSGAHPHAAAIGDFNNDGRSDIVVANYGTNNVGILVNQGISDFNNIITYSTGVSSAPCSVAVSDFNNDNHSDIVVANCETDNLAILLGFGNGTFAIGATYPTGDRSHPCSVAIADFNNDNMMDIVVANSGTNDIHLLYGYGNGTFGNTELYQFGYDYRPYSVAVNDLNQDGWMDIVIACYGTDNVEILMKTC